MCLSKVICFDLDGPIINCTNRYYEVYRTSMLQLGGIPITKEVFWDKKRNRTDERILLEESNVDTRYFDDYLKLKISKIECIEFLNLDSLQPEASAMLSLSREYFQKIFLISLRRHKKALEEQLSNLGIMNKFDHVLSGYRENVPAWKVKTDLFSTILPAHKWSAVGGIFVGDTETDILAGKEIGLVTVAVLSGIRSREMIENYKPDHIINNIGELKKLTEQSYG